MSNGEDMAIGFFKSFEDERRLQAEEFQIRYAERRRRKMETRREIEDAAVKICAAVAKATADGGESLPTETLVQLATALGQTAMAIQAAEQYAEYTPYNSGGFCAV